MYIYYYKIGIQLRTHDITTDFKICHELLLINCTYPYFLSYNCTSSYFLSYKCTSRR